jgi:murein DD-endopeptidase MepM/ murein hydrolase activator NlpD
MTALVSESYDPRTWVAGWSPSVPARRAASPLARRELLGVAGAAAVLGVGGMTAWLSRPAAPARIAARPGGPAAEPAIGRNQLRRTLQLSRAADLESALTANGVPTAAAKAAAQTAQGGLKASGDIHVVLTLTDDGGTMRLDRLEASNDDGSGVVVMAGADGTFAASTVAAQMSSKIIVRRGTMDADSFYSSAVAAGVTDSLIPVFAKALAFDFDFQREVRAGDAFEAAFAQPMNARGEPVGAPTLLYASLSTESKSSAVYRFAPDGRNPEWFDGSGRSIVRALMRTPVDGARVSSNFGFRIHPVLGFMKLHKGTDFAAPIGTPIYASGNAEVEFAGPKGPNGNFVKLRHDNGWETLYLHMNRFAPGIATGARVAQGQQIGEVGTTGRSTGPHLHYEVHIDGEPVDPMSIETEAGRTLEGAQLIAFEKERDRIDVSRAGQS